MRDHTGRSPLDRALDNGYVDVPYYLFHLGYGSDRNRVKLLCNASYRGKLDVVQELVEQHKVDPSECVLMITLPLQYSMQTVGTMHMASVVPVQ